MSKSGTGKPGDISELEKSSYYCLLINAAGARNEVGGIL
jgi:hypothetical protein